MKRNGYRLFMLGALLLVSLSETAFAEGLSGAAHIDQITAQVGQVVEIPLVIDENPGISGALFTIIYDEGLVLNDIRSGNALSSLTMTKSGKVVDNSFKILWDGPEDDSSTGTIAVLSFICPSNEGIYDIKMVHATEDVLDDMMNPVSIITTNGNISVSGVDHNAVLKLPSELTKIEEEAFVGVTVPVLDLRGTKIVEIQNKAFSNCVNLNDIYLPANVKSIAENAFEGCSDIVIHCYQGTYAETYAKNHAIQISYEMNDLP